MVWGVITSFGSALVSTVSRIGSAVSSFCTTVLPRIVPVLDQVGEVVKAIANVVLSVLGVFQPGEDVEDMGDRALQAAEQDIKPENFDTFDEYLDEIRNFELDPEKSANRSRDEKLAAGLAIGTTGMEKKLGAPEGSLGLIWLLVASSPAYFTAERLINLVQGGSNIVNILHYFEGKLGPADAVTARDALMSLERHRSPDKTDDTLYAELNAARDTVMKLENQY